MRYAPYTKGFLTLSVFGVFVLLQTHAAVGADEATPASCRTRIVDELGTLRDDFRAHVFGSRRYASNQFELLTGGPAAAARTGILETKGRLTSELVTPVVESYRVLQCRMNAVCNAMNQSFAVAGNTPLTLRQFGCTDGSVGSFGECSFKDRPFTQKEFDDLAQECARLVTTSLGAERSVLTLAFSYDSGYRSMLQFAGMIDWFQGDLPRETMQPLRDMVKMLGKLHEIPCFIGQCDRPDTSAIGPPKL